MKNEDLVNYELAVKLNELGFNEKTKKQIGKKTKVIYNFGDLTNIELESNKESSVISLPTYEQAIEWLVEMVNEANKERDDYHERLTESTAKAFMLQGQINELKAKNKKG